MCSDVKVLRSTLLAAADRGQNAGGYREQREPPDRIELGTEGRQLRVVARQDVSEGGRSCCVRCREASRQSLKPSFRPIRLYMPHRRHGSEEVSDAIVIV